MGRKVSNFNPRGPAVLLLFPYILRVLAPANQRRIYRRFFGFNSVVQNFVLGRLLQFNYGPNETAKQPVYLHGCTVGPCNCTGRVDVAFPTEISLGALVQLGVLVQMAVLAVRVGNAAAYVQHRVAGQLHLLYLKACADPG